MTDRNGRARPNSLPEPIRLCRGELLAALARVLDYQPGPEVPHHGRVAALAAHIASRVRGVDRRDAFYAGLVHDVGLADGPWDFTHPLNLAEQANRPLVRSHPLAGAQMLADVPGLYGVAEIVLDHHEWVNGHGYPRGKVGREIGLAAQVLRLADTCDFVLREQGAPELLPLLEAVRNRLAGQVAPGIAEAGIEVLGEAGFYAQLLTADDVRFLVESTIRRLAIDDVTTAAAEVTALLELFATVTDAHAADHIGHSRRVANWAVLVAMAMGLEPDATLRLRWAALVHDLGMVTVPKALLDEPRMLSAEELAAVRRHSARTEEFLTPIRGFEDVTAVAVGHSEAFDGTGFPRGLAGDAIPLGGRVIAVCDTFDALTSRRPYRAARDTGLAIDILVRGSGSLFDPDVVSAAVPVFLISQPAHEEQPVHA